MQDRIKYLLEKYLDDNISSQEFDELFSSIGAPASTSNIEGVLTARLKTSEGKPLRKLVIACAAAAALIMLFFALATPSRMRTRVRSLAADSSAAPSNTVTRATKRSEFKYLLLPDSTQVWLNAASTLEFSKKFNQQTREVRLIGEAFFDVKHADRIPFVISTGRVSTIVLGTALNIKAYPDLEKITVSVQRGKVKVRCENKDVAVLVKGQQATIENDNRQVKETPIKAAAAVAWHEGNLSYDDYTIGDIALDLQRVYDVSIKISDPAIAAMRVSTKFRKALGVDAALDVLCRLADTQVKQQEGTYIIGGPK